MVRYDPTEGKHEKYEMVAPKPEKVKKKKKKKIEEVKETEPMPVSNEVFYSVSDKLSNSLAEGEQFSLLKTLGKESTEEPSKFLTLLSVTGYPGIHSKSKLIVFE